MKLTKKYLLSGLVTFAMVLAIFVPALMLTTVVGAATTDDDYTFDMGQFQQDAGLGDASLQNVVGSIIRIIMSVLGVLAVLIILWGGFTWMTAGGEPEKVEKAKKLIISGIIGLVIIMISYAIATFVIGAIQNATGGTTWQ